MRVVPCGFLIVASALASLSSAPQRPDFSGHWVASTNAPPDVPIAPSPVLGPRLSIGHQGDTLTVTRPFRDELMVLRFALDGRRTEYRVPQGTCRGDATYFESAIWEDQAIAMTLVGTIQPGGGPIREQKIRRILRRQGPDTLIVEGTMMQAGKPAQAATVYSRSAEPPPALPAAAPPIAGPPATIAQIAWLPGFWVGKTAAATVEERWTPAASGSTIGLARTLRGESLASFEFLCISERHGTLVYTAMPGGRTTPTQFTLTQITESSATFENPAHDFPQMIRYTRRPDGALETTISGANNARAQSVVLERKPGL